MKILYLEEVGRRNGAKPLSIIYITENKYVKYMNYTELGVEKEERPITWYKVDTAERRLYFDVRRGRRVEREFVPFPDLAKCELRGEYYVVRGTFTKEWWNAEVLDALVAEEVFG